MVISRKSQNVELVKRHRLYSGMRNQGIGLTHEKSLDEICLIRIKEQVDEKKITVGAHRNTDCVEKYIY